MYQFGEDLPEEDQEFWGYNTGQPWLMPNSSGMLNSNRNILTFPCEDSQKSVPYFKKFEKDDYASKGDINQMDDYLLYAAD